MRRGRPPSSRHGLPGVRQFEIFLIQTVDAATAIKIGIALVIQCSLPYPAHSEMHRSKSCKPYLTFWVLDFYFCGVHAEPKTQKRVRDTAAEPLSGRLIHAGPIAGSLTPRVEKDGVRPMRPARVSLPDTNS